MVHPFKVGDAHLEFVVDRFEFEHTSCPGEVHTFRQKRDYLAQHVDVIIVVASGSACCPVRCEQPFTLVKAKRLPADAGQLGSNGNAIHASVGGRIVSHKILRFSTCIPIGLEL